MLTAKTGSERHTAGTRKASEAIGWVFSATVSLQGGSVTGLSYEQGGTGLKRGVIDSVKSGVKLASYGVDGGTDVYLVSDDYVFVDEQIATSFSYMPDGITYILELNTQDENIDFKLGVCGSYSIVTTPKDEYVLKNMPEKVADLFEKVSLIEAGDTVKTVVLGGVMAELN